MIKKILYIGIPNSFENSFFQLGKILVLSIVTMFGTMQITANAVANNLASFGCIPGQAMGLRDNDCGAMRRCTGYQTGGLLYQTDIEVFACRCLGNEPVCHCLSAVDFAAVFAFGRDGAVCDNDHSNP